MLQKLMECARASLKLAEVLVIAEEKRQLLHCVALTQQDVPACQSPLQQFQPTNDTKKIPLDVDEPAKVITIGAGLSAK
jgi:hypothetical protein